MQGLLKFIFEGAKAEEFGEVVLTTIFLFNTQKEN
jgi:hypothetical protein